MLKSFDYVADENAKVLVLGSMPGLISLEEVQYYAHPRNIFWDIMGMMFGFNRAETDYRKRLDILKQNRVALWDVVGKCEREGSLDSSIVTSSVKINDFDSFFDKYKNIGYIVFNGRKAEQLFLKNFSSKILSVKREIQFITMPSTSPANASIKKADKVNAWFQIKKELLEN